MNDENERSNRITRQKLKESDKIAVMIDDLTKDEKIQIDTKLLNKLRRKYKR